MSRSIPNRLGRKRGRFSVDFETNEIFAGIRGQQEAFGDTINYYRFLREESSMDDIYDEGTGAGRVYNGPIPLPVNYVVHLEGGSDSNDTGFYFNDETHVTLSYDAFAKTGMVEADVHHQTYLKDRFVYDDKVFRVTKMETLGQIQQRDIIISIDATQVKPDELVDDLQFAQWANGQG